MADRGANYADKAISRVDKALYSTYNTAQRELRQKLADFNKKFRVKDLEKRKQRDEGKITEQQYKDWLAGQVFMRRQWEQNIKQVCEVMLHHNEQALKIINESSLDTFAENYYAEAFKAQWICSNVSFNVYNTQAIANLIRDNPQILPEWHINEPKDYKWNYKKVNNIVKQGIIQGEGIEQITERLCNDLSTQNENKMRMFARTAMTCAQNAGRQLQMAEGAKLGIVIEKEWLATHDSKTRDSHRHMDGERVPYDEEYSNGLMYPGDPSGAPEEVYNCRCAEKSVYPEYEKREKDWREDVTIDGQSYEEWKEGKKKGRAELAYIKTDSKGNVESDIAGAAGESGNWQKVTKQIEYGELFDEAAVKITKDTLDKLYEEYPLSEPMSIVGDIRVIRNLDRNADGLDLVQEYNFGAHYLNRHNTVIQGGGAGIEVLHETYGTYSLQTEFRERAVLREKYGRMDVHTAFHTSSDSLEGTIMHEYAHAIQEEFGLYGGSRDKAAVEFSEWLYKYWDTHIEDVRQISNYAASHPFEMMAEAFVQIHDIEHTGTTAYNVSREIWDEFDNYRLRKGRYGK